MSFFDPGFLHELRDFDYLPLEKSLREAEYKNTMERFPVQETGNERWMLAYDFVQETGENIFLTGRAGTGKTTFLHRLKEKSSKRLVVTAPTGVAAINAGGVTLHSFFQLPFGPFVPTRGIGHLKSKESAKDQETQHFNKEKIALIQSLDLLVIDEISMVRADLLDSVDAVLRRYRDRTKPFGGIQLLMIGDLQQLPPVAREEDRLLLKDHYDTLYFFSSQALRQTRFITIELEHVYRQKDQDFIALLNRIRDNTADRVILDKLNKRYIPGFIESEGNDGYIILTTHNARADSINIARLEKLKGKTWRYHSRTEDSFPESSYPADKELILKPGAQVMFLKNDPSREKRFFNGKIGIIEELDEESVLVRCEDSSEPIEVGRHEWTNTRYTLDRESGEISEKVEGRFFQIPLRLAWAVTIHKSQGLTFDRAVIDARSAFAHGQVYVALSRCRSLEGIVLSTELPPQAIITDRAVSEFHEKSRLNLPGPQFLQESKKAYQLHLLKELFDFSALLRQAEHCSRVFMQYRESLILDYESVFGPITVQLKNEVMEYARKFSIQIAERLRETELLLPDDPMQQRIGKATEYFSGIIKTEILQKTEGLDIDTDNQAVRKILSDATVRLHTLALVKFRILESCLNGFSVGTYLDAKAKAMLEKPAKSRKRRLNLAVREWDNLPVDPDLYDKLKEWRARVSEDSNLPLYMIMPNSTLAEVARKKPLTSPVLRAIKGIGRKKYHQFGEEILEIVRMHLKLTGSDGKDYSPLDQLDKKLKLDPPPSKPKSPEISIELAFSGKSIKEIAKHRGLSISTVQEHLEEGIKNGRLDIGRYVQEEKAEKIRAFFLKEGYERLQMAKEALGEEVDYWELRFVRSDLSRERGE